MRDLLQLQIHIRQLLAHHQLSGNACHRDTTHLADQRHRATRAWIGLKHIDGVIIDGVLHVHQADNVKFYRYPTRVVADRLNVLRRNVYRRYDAGRIARMHSCLLNMLHDRRHKRVAAIGHGVCLGLDRIL